MKNKTKLSFQPPSWKKLQIMQIFPTATVAVAEGLKSLATAVELRPLVQHCLLDLIMCLVIAFIFQIDKKIK